MKNIKLLNEVRIYDENGQRVIFLEGEKTRLRVATEERIQKMSDGSLRGYGNKVLAWSDKIHATEDEEAIEAVDYLSTAIGRERLKRKKENDE